MTEAMIKICGLALLCAISAMLLGRMRGEFSGMIRLAGGIVIFGTLLWGMASLLDQLSALFAEQGIREYADVMLRALGICILSRVCCEVCRDCGEGGLALGVELSGRAAILSLCLPFVGEILSMAAEILELEG